MVRHCPRPLAALLVAGLVAIASSADARTRLNPLPRARVGFVDRAAGALTGAVVVGTQVGLGSLAKTLFSGRGWLSMLLASGSGALLAEAGLPATHWPLVSNLAQQLHGAPWAESAIFGALVIPAACTTIGLLYGGQLGTKNGYRLGLSGILRAAQENRALGYAWNADLFRGYLQ